MSTKKKMLLAAAGNVGGGGGATNVEDVFSTYLYEGSGASQVIENGINLGQSFGSGSVDFDGSGDYLRCDAALDGLTATSSVATIDGWFNWRDATSVFETIVACNRASNGENEMVLSIRNDGTFEVRYRHVEEVTTATITKQEWNFFSVQFNNGSNTFEIFLNGSSVFTSASAMRVPLSDCTFLIGSEADAANAGSLGNWWSGYLSNIRVSDNIRSTTTPTSDFSSDGNTDFLTCQEDGGFTDNSSNSETVTKGGNPTARTFGPFDAAKAGEGGLVWIKARDITPSWRVFDTKRGPYKELYFDNNLAEIDRTSGGFGLSSFTSSGFTLDNYDYNGTNQSGEDYASWTFRKAPKFFDVVTYTGDGVAGREIAHDLGSTPAVIITKNLNDTENWQVYHKDLGNNQRILLNQDFASGSAPDHWNSTTPTDTVFTVGTHNGTNGSGDGIVAYLFAHNDGDGEFGPDGDADIIKCGSYTGTGSAGNSINLGFEAQWVLMKRSDGSGHWKLFDVMRGMGVAGYAVLEPDTNVAESTGTSSIIAATSTGFEVNNTGSTYNTSGGEYIYIAIRRGTKVPESGDEVFEPTAYTGNNLFNRTIGNLTIDMNLLMDRNRGSSMSNGGHVWDRLRGEDVALKTNVNLIENAGWSDDFYNLDQQYGFSNGNNASYLNNTSADYISYIWKRAPKFFDVVNYVGDGTGDHDVSHSLGVAPEMIWVKSRDASYTNDWRTYHKDLTSNAYYLKLHSTDAEVLGTDTYAETDPTSSVFTVGESITTNKSGDDYIAYLFATLDGVSKVGSYTGTGASQVIDCGFTSGARFVLVKRVDGNESWYVYDTERGINPVGTGDPRLALNNSDAETSAGDDVYADASGFGITGTNTPNVSGGEYIFYAIA